MIAQIAARGTSFKGAGLYYLHDKKADTSERVAWTQTRNIPVSYTHLRAHETPEHLVCRLLLEKKKV